MLALPTGPLTFCAEPAVAESNYVLIHAAGRQRDNPLVRGGEEVRNEVADLHDGEIVTGRIEAEGHKIADEVIGLASAREDRPNTARCDDGDVAADRVSSQDANDLPP